MNTGLRGHFTGCFVKVASLINGSYIYDIPDIYDEIEIRKK